jgi:ParB family transcriptional regulator, chromosome partitioning protein
MSPSAARPSGLGRGLASLIPTRSTAVATPAEIPVDRVRSNPYQPRRDVEEEGLRGLAASVAEHGILQPILVTETVDGYQLIAGERRLRAARLAGLERIPAIVRQMADAQQLQVALVENIQRADLNALEEAVAYRQLIDEFGLSQDDVARRVGRARSSVANTLRLLDLAAPVQDAIRAGTISEGHGRAIASIETADGQEALLAEVAARALSVRQAEQLSRRFKTRLAKHAAQIQAASVAPPVAGGAGIPAVIDDRDPDLERIEGELQASFGTKVTISRSRRGGRITIEFYDEADLERLFERLTGQSA